MEDFLEEVIRGGPVQAQSAAKHVKECLAVREPRLREARHGDGSVVEEGEPKKYEKRLEERLKNVYKTTVDKLRGTCCKEGCLAKLNAARLVVEALSHQSESFEGRATALSRSAKDHMVSDSQGKIKPKYRVQYRDVCATAFAVSRGISASTLARRRKGLEVSDFVESREHASKGVSRPTGDRQASAQWMLQFFGRFAQPFPHKTTRGQQTGELRTLQFLPTHLFSTLSSVYDSYVEDCREARRPSVSFNTFRRAWLSAHFEVGILLCYYLCMKIKIDFACKRN